MTIHRVLAIGILTGDPPRAPGDQVNWDVSAACYVPSACSIPHSVTTPDRFAVPLFSTPDAYTITMRMTDYNDGELGYSGLPQEQSMDY